ncbi:condensation domain-containing protein, partial [Maribacter sp. 2-571]|uniref:condensation domain-containing protein n=1 Tax=Maribacter sp. 2-571 TaxID=3417569 RepID=UPI003D33EEF8
AFKKKDRETRFDLSEAPLVRITLIKTGEESYTMYYTNHHILTDGWSMSIVIDELLQAYQVIFHGGVPEEIQEDRYRDYIDFIGKKDPFEEEDFWKNYMATLDSPTLLPFVSADHDRNKTAGETNLTSLVVGKELTDMIKGYAQEHGLTVNSITQGVWSLLLSKYTGSQDVIFGVTVSGRPPEMEFSDELVGLYINTLPLYGAIPEGPIVDWLIALQMGHTECREHQYTNLSIIQSLSGVKGDLFDSIMVFENFPEAEASEGGEQVLEVDDMETIDPTNYPLTIVVNLTEKLDIEFGYNSSLISEQTIEMIKGHFRTVLEQIINANVSEISEIDLLTAGERTELLDVFNGTDVDYALDVGFVGMFESRVSKSPDGIALSFEGETMSYGELDALSNRIAHYLVSKGVVPDSLVGICLDRSLWMIAGVVGILKSGGGYV